MNKKNILNQVQYESYLSIQKFCISFSSSDCFLYRLGFIPDEPIIYHVAQNDQLQSINALRILFIQERYSEHLKGIEGLFNIINRGKTAITLRFNKNHAYKTKAVDYDQALGYLDANLKKVLALISNLKSNGALSDKTCQEKIIALRQRYNQINEFISKLRFSGAESKVYLSNFYRRIMYDYVYIMYEDKKSNKKEKFHL
jgi:hypothetical protein